MVAAPDAGGARSAGFDDARDGYDCWRGGPQAAARLRSDRRKRVKRPKPPPPKKPEAPGAGWAPAPKPKPDLPDEATLRRNLQQYGANLARAMALKREHGDLTPDQEKL